MNKARSRPQTLAGRHAVVIGGGIAGLGAALVLAQRGAEVTVLERDDDPTARSAEEAFSSWDRSGAPQVRHSHVFLGRLRKLLHDEYPDLLAAVLAAGARELRPLDRPPPALAKIEPQPEDADLVTLGMRRITFEWVLRQEILRLGAVRFVPKATVVGLVASPSAPPVVAGVRFRNEQGEQIRRGHLIVDASGRRSLAPSWLKAVGARPIHEKQESSGVVYYTRFYRMRPGASEPAPTADPLAADFNWVKYAIFPADGRVFSITLAVPLAFQRLKVLAQAPAFDAMVDCIPALRPWADADFAEPIGDRARPVQAMGGLINRARRFVDDRGPLALRFFVLGDAAYCTNPLYGRGCSQGLLHAHFLGEALDAHADDWAAVAVALDRRGRDELEPYYRASILADRDAVRRAEGRAPRKLVDRMQQRFFEDGVALAMRTDPLVFRAFLRMLNMFETPERAFGRPDVVARVLWVMAQGESYKQKYRLADPPDREATFSRCEAALCSGETVLT
ncbi:MAG: FAD-dependent oxidoreductase [Deltaproteobacteria bacterium]|nr:FAD-dependent oxidoreductase [Deltaproteobacteria bacterium]